MRCHRRIGERGSARTCFIAGAGIAGVEALLALRAVAGQDPGIELFSPDPNLTYRPLRVTKPFELGDVRRFSLEDIAADQRATFRFGALTSVDPQGRRARQRSGEWLSYDDLRTRARPVEASGGRVTIADGPTIPADGTITVPCLEGRRIFGLPADSEGFIPVDVHGRVKGSRACTRQATVRTSP